ncbi:MAG TPA: HK97 family phage prohead protease [Vicinamibacterales bacterium]
MGRVETRESAKTASLFGHAAVFNKETTIDMGMFAFREQVAPGAFRRAIREDDVRALFNHNPSIVLGRNRNHTLRLEEDSIGLRYEATLPKTVAASDVRELILGGYVTGSSFGFTLGAGDDIWDESEMKKGKLPLRTIRNIARLLDVSPVTYPAYLAADSQARGTEMRERTDESRSLPMNAKAIMKHMQMDQYCWKCRRHVGLGWVVRGAYAMHPACAESFDLDRRADDHQRRIETRLLREQINRERAIRV